MTPWQARIESILGLYEYPGAADNPCILAMAKQCGGNIAKTYKHDATAWCALTVNWCLITSGLKGTGTLWALDFRKLVKLPGPCPGAIATKTRQGGGHVFIVRGRTAAGAIVGTGGNQSDMVCDEGFTLSALQFNWPAGVPLPKTGVGTLPIVTVRPKAHKTFTSLPGLDPQHPALAAEVKQVQKATVEAAQKKADTPRKTAEVVVKAAATAGAGAVLAQGSGSHWGLWIGAGAAIALVVGFVWKYRAEIKAILQAKYGRTK